ncbi:uncharacterized protein [Periplaneta americana]|uniref:uncharacterized protein n=1 Tax=Periplaneta americana TaxID=6978 RepID=UPI0037E88379
MISSRSPLFYYKPEMYFSPLLSRSLRSEDGTRKNLKCCRRPEPQYTEKDVRIFNRCVEETKPKASMTYTPGDADKEVKKRYVCLLHCCAKHLGMIDAGGYLIEDKLAQFIKNSSGSSVFYNENKDILEKCGSFANKYSKDHVKLIQYYERKCNAAIVALYMCVNAFAELNCSDQRQIKSAECDKYRHNTRMTLEALKLL